MKKKLVDFGETIPMARKDGEITTNQNGISWKGTPKEKIIELAKILKDEFADEDGDYNAPYQTALFFKIAVEKMVKYYFLNHLNEKKIDLEAFEKNEKFFSFTIESIVSVVLASIYEAKKIPEDGFADLANHLTTPVYAFMDSISVSKLIWPTANEISALLKVAEADSIARLDSSGIFTGDDAKAAIIEKKVRILTKKDYCKRQDSLLAYLPVKQDFRRASHRSYRFLTVRLNSSMFEYSTKDRIDIDQSNCFLVNCFDQTAMPFEDYDEAVKGLRDLRKVVSTQLSIEEILAGKEKVKKKVSRRPRWFPEEKEIKRTMPHNWLKSHKATPKDYLDILGVYGCQFGNYVPQDLRQNQMNMAFEAYVDLAQILGIAPSDIFFKEQENARLAIAFGARGRGGSSGGIAHFEPFYEVMNFTKRKGYGCLAHEWGHAFDNFLYKSMTGETKKAKGNPFIIGVPYQSFERFNWNFLSDELTIIRDILNARHCEYRSISYQFGSRFSGGEKYWCSKEEMFARAFEAYVLDKMAEKGYVSDALCFEHTNYPYPQGEERKKINKAIDGIFAKLKEHGIFHPFDEKTIVPEETKKRRIIIGTDDYASQLQIGNGGQISFVAM